jgi:N-acetylglucosaminyl-diphospho-decaprenol L-rhamnosyltransferase
VTQDQPRLGVVVVNYGSHRLLERNLTAIDLGEVPATLLVVDNFHSIEEREAITALATRERWRVLERPDNGGFGRANNEAASVLLAEGCTAVLMLNPDVEIDTATVRALLDAATAQPDALIAPQIRRPDGSLWFSGGALSLRDGMTRTRPGTVLTQEEGWLTGACLVVSAQLWRAVGGFDLDYFLYWEDVDLSRRCVEVGGRLVLRQDLTVVHDVGGTQPGTGKSGRYLYYNCRNRLLFAAKHLDRRGILRWLVATPRASWRVLARDGRRHLLRRPGTAVEAVRGSFAGAADAVRALCRPRTQTVRDDEG